MRAARWILGSILLAAAVVPSSAQQFPTKPITLVVPYAPGGNVDISTRILQAGIGDALGQPIIIENRPGAGRSYAVRRLERLDPARADDHAEAALSMGQGFRAGQRACGRDQHAAGD